MELTGNIVAGRSRKRWLLPAFFLLMTCVLLRTQLPPGALWITDNGNKYMVMRRFAETGQGHFGAATPLFPRGGFHFVDAGDGVMRSFHSPLLPLVTAPFYRCFGEAALPVWAVMGTLGVLILLCCQMHREREAWALLLTTPLWFYSLLLWEMTPSVFFSLLAFLCCDRGRFTWAGAAVGAGIWFREELILLGGAMGVVLLLKCRWREALHLAAGAAALLLPLAIGQKLLTGSWIGLHAGNYFVNNRPGGFSFAAELKGILFNCYQHGFRFETAGNFSLWLSCGSGALLIAAGALRDAKKWKCAALILFCAVEVFLALMLWRRGFASPLYTAALTMGVIPSIPLAAGFFLNWRDLVQSPNFKCAFPARVLVLYLLLVPPLLTRFDIGLTWGARHFFCLLPMLLPLSFRSFRLVVTDRRLRIAVAALLFLCGLSMQIWAFAALKQVSWSCHDFEARVQSLPEQIIVTDLFFIPEQTPHLFFTKKICEVITPGQWQLLKTQLKAEKCDRFILLLSPRFRRIDDRDLAALLEEFPPISPPERTSLTPELEIFITRCQQNPSIRRNEP